MISDSVYPLGQQGSLLNVSNWNHGVPEFEFEFPTKANVLPVWNTSLKTHQEKLHISALSAPWVLQPLLSCRGCVAPYYRPISQKRHSRSFSAVSASPLYGVRDILILPQYPQSLFNNRVCIPLPHSLSSPSSRLTGRTLSPLPPSNSISSTTAAIHIQSEAQFFPLYRARLKGGPQVA